MKFEKEILADYDKLIDYAKYVKTRHKTRLRANVCAAEEADFVNEAVVEFTQSGADSYDIKALQNAIQRSMYREEKIQKSRVGYDHISTYSPKDLIKPTEKRSVPTSELQFSNEILRTKPIFISKNCMYFILKDGRCVSHRTSVHRFKFLLPQVRSDGYVMFVFSGGYVYAHRAVYLTHVGPIPEDMEVHHIDHDKQNNHIDNLMLVTHSENLKFYHSTYSRNKNIPYAKRVVTSTKKGAPFGDRHGKFKGYYIIFGKQYESSYLAEKATGVNYRTIQRRCKAGKPGYSFINMYDENG